MLSLLLAQVNRIQDLHIRCVRCAAALIVLTIALAAACIALFIASTITEDPTTKHVLEIFIIISVVVMIVFFVVMFGMILWLSKYRLDFDRPSAGARIEEVDDERMSTVREEDRKEQERQEEEEEGEDTLIPLSGIINIGGQGSTMDLSVAGQPKEEVAPPNTRRRHMAKYASPMSKPNDALSFDMRCQLEEEEQEEHKDHIVVIVRVREEDDLPYAPEPPEGGDLRDQQDPSSSAFPPSQSGGGFHQWNAAFNLHHCSAFRSSSGRGAEDVFNGLRSRPPSAAYTHKSSSQNEDYFVVPP